MKSILKTHRSSLNDETFRTFLAKVEAVVNSRPLTVENLNDPNSLSPLTPNHLLTMKSKVVIAPPGVFQKPDLYCRRQWRRVQHLVNEFWSRWRKEYLQSLQPRQKWVTTKCNFMVNDVVILKDQTEFRNDWRLARIVKTNPDKDDIVRSVSVQTADHQIYERPISKLVLLVGADEFRIPDKEPTV